MDAEEYGQKEKRLIEAAGKEIQPIMNRLNKALGRPDGHYQIILDEEKPEKELVEA